MARTKRTRDFADVIRAKLEADPELAKSVAEEKFHAEVARKVYALRTEAGLTQRALARLIGTQQSVISRIEDAEYNGHSLSILFRIAYALKKRLSIDFFRRTPFHGPVRRRVAAAKS